MDWKRRNEVHHWYTKLSSFDKQRKLNYLKIIDIITEDQKEIQDS